MAGGAWTEDGGGGATGGAVGTTGAGGGGGATGWAINGVDTNVKAATLKIPVAQVMIFRVFIPLPLSLEYAVALPASFTLAGLREADIISSRSRLPMQNATYTLQSSNRHGGRNWHNRTRLAATSHVLD